MSGKKSRTSHFKRRRRRGSHLGVTGKFPSSRNDHSLFYESLRERDLFVLTEFDDQIEGVEDHPISIEYEHNGRKRQYTPDARIRFRDERAEQLIEVKVSEELERNAEKFAPPFAAARAYCESRGLQFRVMTDQDMPRPRVTNLRFLLPYRRVGRDVRIEAEIRTAIKSTATLSEVVRTLEEAGTPSTETIVQVWRLVANQQIEVDLDAPLSLASRLTNCPWSLRL